jgi:hypothetical protein
MRLHLAAQNKSPQVFQRPGLSFNENRYHHGKDARPVGGNTLHYLRSPKPK